MPRRAGRMAGFGGHGIVPTAAPRLASAQPFESHPATPPDSMRFHGLKEVARATRLEPAPGGAAVEKGQHRREEHLINPDEQADEQHLDLGILRLQHAAASGEAPPFTAQFFKSRTHGALPCNQHQPATCLELRTITAHDLPQAAPHLAPNDGSANAPRGNQANSGRLSGGAGEHAQDHEFPVERNAFALQLGELSRASEPRGPRPLQFAGWCLQNESGCPRTQPPGTRNQGFQTHTARPSGLRVALEMNLDALRQQPLAPTLPPP